MKIYREISTNERLPEKEGNYWTIRKVGKHKRIEHFIPNYYLELWIAQNEYWLEEIEVELDSEKILPLIERCIDLNDLKTINVNPDAILNYIGKCYKALEAAELENIQLQVQLGEGLTKNFFKRELVKLQKDADERYNNAYNSLPNTYDIDKPTNHKIIKQALKIAAYGTV